MLASTDNYYAPAKSPSSKQLETRRFKYIVYSGSTTSSVTVVSPNEFELNPGIMKLLDEYSYLQDDWDEGNAKAPSIAVIHNAKYITSLLGKHGQRIFHSAPGPNGEIMLDIRNKNQIRSFEIILYEKRSVVVTFPELGGSQQRSFQVTDLPSLLNWLNKK